MCVYVCLSGPGQYSPSVKPSPQMALISLREDRFRVPQNNTPGPGAYQVETMRLQGFRECACMSNGAGDYSCSQTDRLTCGVAYRRMKKHSLGHAFGLVGTINLHTIHYITLKQCFSNVYMPRSSINSGCAQMEWNRSMLKDYRLF